MLVTALESLCLQTIDVSVYEVIVVDNNSTDNTNIVVDEFCRRYFNIRYCRESQQGLSHARYRGWREARGQYVAFMDDDARANRFWLETSLRCFCEIQPTPMGVGGRIVPVYSSPKPKWFRDEWETRSWGERPRFLTKGESFSGSNMIFKKEVLEKFGGFDVRVGVRGPYLSVGEETAVFQKIWQVRDDARFYYSPEMLVYHAVPEYKMTFSYPLKRAFLTGQMWIVQNRPSSLCARTWLLMRILASVGLWIARSLITMRRYPDFHYWAAKCLTPVAVEVGRLTGCLGLFIKVRQGGR
jgi:glycosyltransferase involved in cell wall biosynthesis